MGRSISEDDLKNDSPPISIVPASGVARPEMQSSNVVFPDPDGPKRMLNPARAVNSTSSENSPSFVPKRFRTVALNVLFSDIAAVAVDIFWLFHLAHRQQGLRELPPVETINQHEHSETDQQQEQSSGIGRGVIGRLHLIVNVDRYRPSDSRNIAAHHQHHSELAHRVSEGQSYARDEAWNRERKNHASECRSEERRVGKECR